MRCDVLVFAQLAEAIGSSKLSVEVEDGATVASALLLLAKDHPAIRAMNDRLAVAVNEKYAQRGAVLRDGDVLALIPPVSGG